MKAGSLYRRLSLRSSSRKLRRAARRGPIPRSTVKRGLNAELSKHHNQDDDQQSVMDNVLKKPSKCFVDAVDVSETLVNPSA